MTGVQTCALPISSSFYFRSKGETEKALAELGYKDTVIFRPALLANVKRPEGRLGESILLYVDTELRDTMLTPHIL